MTPRWIALALALPAFGAAGCAREHQRPPCDAADIGGCPIEEIEIEGNLEVDDEDIQERIATAESEHPLGGALAHVPLFSVIDTLTADYERFDRFVLGRDLARIERYYRARGFYGARVRAARVQHVATDKGGHVRVHIVVEEGQPVEIGAVDLEWKDWTLDTGKDVLGPVTEARSSLKVGSRFEEEALEETKKQIARALSDRGFAYASVRGRAHVDLVSRKARVVYTIELGPESRFGAIRLEGLGELPERPLRAALDLEEGERFSTEDLEEAERALADFGVFGAIEVVVHRSPEGKPPNPVVPVTFRVQPAALRTLRLGGGGELGGRAEVHGVVGWEDRNFLGGLRRFSIEGRPGLVFYPTTFSTLFDAPPSDVLPELQIRFELRQPAAIEARTTAVLRGAARLYRLQTSQFDVAEVTEEGAEANIVGYREYAGAIGLERPFLRGDLSAALFYNIQLNDPFSYNQELPPPGFRQLVLPYIQGILAYDRRRDEQGKTDRIDPRKGIYAAVDAQVAGYVFGDADDVRLQPEFRAYVPASRRVTLALRLLTGFLFPSNYGDAFFQQDECLARPEGSDERAACQKALEGDLQLLQFRAFFSGGANSNRGYTYNEVGPHGAVPSLTGLTEGIVPTGGPTLWEASVELRFPIYGNLGAALFVDGSDVTREVGYFRLTRPHLSTGLGLRYATPVGPLRVDVGYRVPCAQVLGVCPGDPLPEDEGVPGTVLGVPIAVNIAIGEAF